MNVIPSFRFNFSVGYPEAVTSAGIVKPVSGQFFSELIEQYPRSEIDPHEIPCDKPFWAQIESEYYPDSDDGTVWSGGYPVFRLKKSTKEILQTNGLFKKGELEQYCHIDQCVQATNVADTDKIIWGASVSTMLFRRIVEESGFIPTHHQSVCQRLQHYASWLLYGLPDARLSPSEILDLARQLSQVLNDSGDQTLSQLKKITTRFSNDPQLRSNYWSSLIFTCGLYPSIGNAEIKTELEAKGTPVGYEVLLGSPDDEFRYVISVRTDNTYITVHCPGKNGQIDLAESAGLIGIKKLFQDLSAF